MKRYQRVISLLVALTLCMAMAACGAGTSAPSSESDAGSAPAEASPAGDASTVESTAPEGTAGEIVFWSWSESETQGLADRFNQQYPDIAVKFVPVDSASYLTKFQTALVSNSELPDVALQEVDARGALFALDCWENLEAAPYNFDRSVVYPQILPVMTNDRDEVIGIERELNPSGMLYKRELTKEYLGTDDPDEVGALISDWDKFIELGGQVAEKSGGSVKFVAGLSDMVSILKAQYVDPVFDGDKAYATQYFQKNLDILIRLNNANTVGKLQTYSPAWNTSFVEDEYIFYPCAPWTGEWILKANDPDGAGRWGVTTAPVKGYSFGGTAYGIPSGAKNKDLAWTFINWAACTDDGTDACAQVVGAIVSRQENYKDGYPNDPDPYFSGQNANAYLMEKAAPGMEIRPLSQYDVSLTDVLTLVADMIANDSSLTTEAAVEYAVTELTNKLPANMTVE